VGVSVISLHLATRGAVPYISVLHAIMCRLVYTLIFLIAAFNGSSQQYSFKASSPFVEATMRKAVANAERFIVDIVPNNLFRSHFTLLTSLSEAKNDSSSYYHPVYFTDSVPFIPNKYELRFLITIEGDTLTDSFVIPIDSSGNTDVDTSHFHYILEDLRAYNRLLLGQFRFDYKDVKQFITTKGLKDYSILLQNSIERINQKEYRQMKPYKYYWFVYRYYPGYEIEYRIDPDTGKYVKTKRWVKAVS
jgi:hypothetical protein